MKCAFRDTDYLQFWYAKDGLESQGIPPIAADVPSTDERQMNGTDFTSFFFFRPHEMSI